MEKHRCKLCHRKFTNGRALGGHMRSHMMNLPIIPKHAEFRANDDNESLSSLAESPSSSSSSSDSESEEDIKEDDDGEKKGRKKGVINTRKSIKLADLEDRESETESTRNPTRRRSKRVRKPPLPSPPAFSFKGFGYGSDQNEGEPVSSISEVASEEDVAFCLMMLSRDTWTCHEKADFGDIINDDDVTGMKRFRCETCNKVFMSYQALGGHRSGHKKTRMAPNAKIIDLHEVDKNNNNNNNNNNNSIEVKQNQQVKKIHECPICLRVFQSGQALGGHKRSHGIGIIENYNQQMLDDDIVDDHQSPKKINKRDKLFIDLNLPAPVEDEEISQIAVSAVSDAHF